MTNQLGITGVVSSGSGLTKFRASRTGTFSTSIDVAVSNDQFVLDAAALAQLGIAADGNYKVYLQAIDRLGNSVTTAPLNFQIDTTSVTPIDPQTVGTGANLVIAGNGAAGDKIELLAGGQVVGNAIVQANGAWRFAGSGLGDGAKVLTARSIDLASNISANTVRLSKKCKIFQRENAVLSS